MKITSLILSVACIVAFTACRQNTQNTYAIRDFGGTLQPYLTKVVSQGIVECTPATDFIEKHATDLELQKLSKSEHPVLRAVANREMLNRPTFNHFDLMMNNLDDTAIVATDAGEWGLSYLRVSDDMLMHGRWKDSAARMKTIEEIILRHNFLACAYQRAGWTDANEKFYSSIKEMVQRERTQFDNFYNQKENALYALAAYNKSGDVPLIKKTLQSNISQAGETSFYLMANFKNDAYLEILEDFYPRGFYGSICKDRLHDPQIAIYFIKTIAVYRNSRSEKILESILNTKPFMPCTADTDSLRRELVYSIWNNSCPAYTKIRKQVESVIKR